MSSCELFRSLKCHTCPFPNPWGLRGRETFEFRAFYAVWWRHLVVYAFLRKFCFVCICTVEPGNSNSTGKRKTVRVIGENFSEILIKGRKFSSSSRRAPVVRVRVIEVPLYVNLYFYTENHQLSLILYWSPGFKKFVTHDLKEVDSIVIFKTVLNDIIF